VIQTLRERAKRGEIAPPEFLYVGSETGLEAKLARENGLPFATIATGKLRRSSKGPLGLLTAANIRDGFRVPFGLLQAAGVVRKFKPDVVFATGGYVAAPPAITAGILGYKVLLHEQTVTVGLANKLIGRWARRIALSFEGAVDDLPPALRTKAFVTGNPIRKSLFEGDATRGARKMDFAPEDNGLPCVYVTGGAQGSRILNRAVEAVLPQLLEQCRIVHQCGKQPEGMEQDLPRLEREAGVLPLHLRQRYRVLPFVESDQIADVFALANLLVSRAGAGTVTEACALGKPAVFVPLVPTSGDEQTRNAQRSVKAGAAVLLPQAECDGPHLLQAVQALLSDPARLQAMSEAAKTLARPNAANDLTDALLELT
jgi:UDP-N-acetylglucosamine--N-acetylmuramyl-(pentapeptide) pyrophosphoryl-undecaprenol N-acetylglucosamine transferase